MPLLSAFGASHPVPPPVDLAVQPAAALTGQCPCGQRRPATVMLGLRSARRPQFEGRWYCRRACLAEAAARAVRREVRNGVAGDSRVRHRVPLGLILQARGVVTYPQLQQALQMQQASGARLGQVLTEHFDVPEERIATALAAQWNCPVWHLPATPPDDLLRLAPSRLFHGGSSVPLRLIGNRLTLASADSIDAPVALALERMHGIQVESGIAVASRLEEFRRRLGKANMAMAKEMECASTDDVVLQASALIAQLQPVESRLVRVGRRLWLRAWLEPAALAGGPLQTDDVVDALFTLPVAQGELRLHPDTVA